MQYGNLKSAADLLVNKDRELLPLPIRITASKIDSWISSIGLLLSVLVLGSHLLGFGLQGTAAYFAIALSLMTSIYFGIAFRRYYPFRPIIEITSQGILYSRFSSKMIQWSSIENIRVLQLQGDMPTWRLDISIRPDAEPALVMRATRRWAGLTHAPGKPNVSISDVHFQNYTYLEVASLLTHCHMRYKQVRS